MADELDEPNDGEAEEPLTMEELPDGLTAEEPRTADEPTAELRTAEEPRTAEVPAAEPRTADEPRTEDEPRTADEDVEAIEFLPLREVCTEDPETVLLTAPDDVPREETLLETVRPSPVPVREP